MTDFSASPSAEETLTPALKWFRARYDGAAQEIIDFLGGAGISMTGKEVADIGSGDGVMSLGIAHKCEPSKLIGYDVRPTRVETLRELARIDGVAQELPSCLSFEASGASEIPAEDDSFDFIFTWSVFEHASDPVGLLKEIRRVMRPYGVLMLQLSPFYHSEHGSHLEDWFPEGFVQLTKDPADIERIVQASGEESQSRTKIMLEEFRTLNKMTLDDLQLALLAAGLHARKVEVLSSPVRIPLELARHSLSQIGISGIKLLAVPC